MTRTVLYPGSFDPPTLGHLDIIRRACRLADRLVIAIGVHASKAPLFSAEERAAMLREVAAPIAAGEGASLEVTTFEGLAIEAARQAGATVVVRGIRNGTDLDYEMQMAAMNQTMAPGVQTIFLPASPAVRPITATLVRQIAGMGGDAAPFVPSAVADRLMAKLRR